MNRPQQKAKLCPLTAGPRKKLKKAKPIVSLSPKIGRKKSYFKETRMKSIRKNIKLRIIQQTGCGVENETAII